MYYAFGKHYCIIFAKGEIKMSIGDRIALLRKREGLTQEQLADILGTTRQAISKWESEKSTPDIDYAIGIGAHFGVSMDYLLLGKENTPGSGSERTPAGNTDNSAKQTMLYRILLIAALIISILILILLPLFATMYKVHMRNLGPVYTDANMYLSEPPLSGIKYLGWFGCTGSVAGLAWTFRKKINSKGT